MIYLYAQNVDEEICEYIIFGFMHSVHKSGVERKKKWFKYKIIYDHSESLRYENENNE